MIYEETYKAFAAYHKQPLNVLLHLLTTPLCIVSALAILDLYTSSTVVMAATGLYALSLLVYLPLRISILNSLALAGMVYLVMKADAFLALLNVTYPPVVVYSILFVAAYFTQDLAHFITGEATFQSTYISEKGGLFFLLGEASIAHSIAHITLTHNSHPPPPPRTHVLPPPPRV